MMLQYEQSKKPLLAGKKNRWSSFSSSVSLRKVIYETFAK